MRREHRLLACLIAAFTGAAIAGALVLQALAGDDADTTLNAVLSCVATLATSGVGLVLAIRRSQNSIGWILLASGAFVALNGLATCYARYGLLAEPGSLPAADWAVVFEDRTWPLFFIGVTAIAFVFPSGRLPADRRRWGAVTAIAFVVLQLAALFSTDAFGAPFQSVVNPVPAIPKALVSGLFLIGFLGVLGGMISAALSLHTRFRDSKGAERQQLRWLAFGASLVPVVIVVCLAEAALTGSDGPATLFSLSAVLTAIPLAIGVAVMRYRLYEIDRLINRTLVYVTLTALLAAAFALVTISAGVTVGSGSELPTAAATLVVALAFGPVRARVQVAVDRRFDRARYEGLRQIDEFLAELRTGGAAPESTGQVLASALGDPALELLFWLSPEDPSVDIEGRPRLPAEGDTRTRTPVMRGSLLLGTVLHSPELADRPDLLDTVIEAAGLAIEIGRLRVEVRRRLAEVEESRARIVTAGIAERRRLERDLHDGAQQRLVTIGLELRHLQGQLADSEGPTHDSLDGIVSELSEAIDELRELARGVRPPALDDGLGPALEQLTSRAPMPTSVSATPERFSEEIEAAAYFVASEALTNAFKHSGASRASVQAARENGSLVVSIEDDGVGGATPGPGSGLEGISDRLAALGGEMTVRSLAGQGTTVRAELPCG